MDDSRDARESLAMIRLAWDHQPRVAPTGPSALEAVAEFRPQVWILDTGPPVPRKPDPAPSQVDDDFSARANSILPGRES